MLGRRRRRRYRWVCHRSRKDLARVRVGRRRRGRKGGRGERA